MTSQSLLIEKTIAGIVTFADELVIIDCSTLKMQKKASEDQDQSMTTPKSMKTTKKDLHLKKLSTIVANFPIENCKTFVVGISGGDCAGKREMIQYMFDRNQEGWFFKESKEQVTILHQSYFTKNTNGSRYTAEGTDWNLFYKNAVSLLIGNEVTINYRYHDEQCSIRLKPAKLMVIEGSHIFMSPEITKNLSTLINLKVFIDSDSDVRLSRRVYQDTQQRHMDLNTSVANYMQFIKPSYEKQIEPTKQTSDIIIPHFGGGFNDHKKENKNDYSSNIKVACNLILTHLKEEMKKYEEEISSEVVQV